MEDRVYLHGVGQVESVGVGTDSFNDGERALVLEV
jgi:hypothetical protein